MQARFLTFASAALLWAGLALAQININTASREELDSLKGIGKARAEAIIKYRSENGPFKSVDDLKNIPNFPDNLVGKLRGQITVVGAPTVKAPPAPSAKTAVEPARPAVQTASRALPGPAVPAMLGKPAGPVAPSKTGAPAQSSADLKPAPARPAAPAMPARPMAEGKPAAPATAAPAAPARPAAPAMPGARSATPAVPASPAVPARPAAPARPASAN